MTSKNSDGEATIQDTAKKEVWKETVEKRMEQKILAVAFYWFVSISLTFLNKTVMTGDYLNLDAPLFLSWTQFVMTIVCWLVMCGLRSRIKMFSFFPAFELNWKKSRRILPLTIVFLGMIIFNNLCIKHVEVSFYYIARSLTIIFNIVLTYYILNKVTSKSAIGCCLMIIFGYILGVQSEVHFSMIGVFFGVLASIHVALNSIFAKKMLSEVVNESPELLMWYNNINGIIILPILALFCSDELTTLRQPEAWEAVTSRNFWMMILFTGFFGFLIGYASYIQVLYTSPLTHNVSGTAKAAFQTILAFWIYGNPTNMQNIISVAVVLLSSFAYARVK